MEESIGRDTAPTTEAAAPDAGQLDSPELVAPALQTSQLEADVARRLRDLPPSTLREDTGITDLDELQRELDPLDPRRPGRPTGDPLDPDGGVI
jgi:hypothetical protein